MSTSVVDTGVRARTRQAILDAATSVLSRRAGASLAEVAEAAGVGRTTVHRYFPERSDLIDALSRHMLDRIADAVHRARLGEGTGRAALVRACRELYDLGDLLVAVTVGDPSIMECPEWQQPNDIDAALLAAAARGHADGSIDPALPPQWVSQGLLWALLYAAVQHVRDHGGSRHDALEMALISFDGAMRPR